MFFQYFCPYFSRSVAKVEMYRHQISQPSATRTDNDLTQAICRHEIAFERVRYLKAERDKATLGASLLFGARQWSDDLNREFRERGLDIEEGIRVWGRILRFYEREIAVYVRFASSSYDNLSFFAFQRHFCSFLSHVGLLSLFSIAIPPASYHAD